MYSNQDVLTFVEEEDVKFIRLSFHDIYGTQKNISIMPNELARAFREGISFDASAIAGFGDEVESDLFLHPDPSTLSILPWRPSHGRVVRMSCDIRHPDGRPFTRDTRRILKNAIAQAEEFGLPIGFGTEMEFYLFETDDNGQPTMTPFDNAGYMDVAPADKGENIRREICFTLIEMGMLPEASHHEEGPGQNEIDFLYSDALTTAENATIFKWVVRTIAARNGLHADFSPKPLSNQAGNGMHVNLSVESRNGNDYTNAFIAGIMKYIAEMTLFLNPVEASYSRLGEKKAPRYITWSKQNRSQLIRIPAVKSSLQRIELRSPDPSCNVFISFALLIYAGLSGIKDNLTLEPPCNQNLFTADSTITDSLRQLPSNLLDAKKLSLQSEFIKQHLPEELIQSYCEIPNAK